MTMEPTTGIATDQAPSTSSEMTMPWRVDNSP
jgi:hypothetical protein